MFTFIIWLVALGLWIADRLRLARPAEAAQPAPVRIRSGQANDEPKGLPYDPAHCHR